MYFSKKIDKYMAVEIISGHYDDYDLSFDLIFSIQLKGDHPGLFFYLFVKGLKFEFNYYDIRHTAMFRKDEK
jgi:hypothetical protein